MQAIPYMHRIICFRFLMASFIVAMAAGVSLAAGKGQDDLNKATQTKLASDTVTDLGEVIRLAESALEKGLEPADAAFAKKLIASTLLERAQVTAKYVFNDSTSADDFRQRRKFALADLEKCIKLDAKQPEPYLLMAQLNLLPGGPGLPAVRASLDKAIELAEDDPTTQAKALVLRADLQEKAEKKLADLDRAVPLMPGDASVLRARGAVLLDLDKLERAAADFARAIEFEPDNEPTYEAQAIVLAELKKYDEALAALDRAARLKPDRAEPLLQQAHSLRQRKPDAATCRPEPLRHGRARQC